MRIQAISLVLGLVTTVLAINVPADASYFSSWMINSIASYGQGLANSRAATGEIEPGIFQSALRRAIDASEYSHEKSNSTRWNAYLSESLRSSFSGLSNATEDALMPLDRFSVGSALLHQYSANATGAAYRAIISLRQSVNLHTRNV